MHPIASKIDRKIFRLVGQAADTLGQPAYVVGGYVRDLFLDRTSKDIDFVTVGSCSDLARAVAAALGPRVRVTEFKTYGTAQVKHRGQELEFVAARRESYNRDSRNPVVEAGTLEDDIARRDFTINAMALCVNTDRFGDLIDRYNGLADLRAGLIRTPLDPDITFSDDPLRMFRAIRFATQLQFTIVPETFEAIRRNAHRADILKRERIAVELNKIMASPRPSIGWTLLLQSGLLQVIMPQLAAMRGVDTRDGRGHKDNFQHTMTVLDNVAAASDNLWLRWAALLHDIGKPACKRYVPGTGWTFYGHNIVGARMVPAIFKQLRLPQDNDMKYVRKLVELHMRPIALVEEVTDSAVRRLMTDAGMDLDDLMILAKADITSRNAERVRLFLHNFDIVCDKFADLKERDDYRLFKNPVDGNEIMALFGLPQSPAIGVIAHAQKDAILDGVIPNTHDDALRFIIRFAADKLNLHPINDTSCTTSPNASK